MLVFLSPLHLFSLGIMHNNVNMHIHKLKMNNQACAMCIWHGVNVHYKIWSLLQLMEFGFMAMSFLGHGGSCLFLNVWCMLFYWFGQFISKLKVIEEIELLFEACKLVVGWRFITIVQYSTLKSQLKTFKGLKSFKY